MCCALFGGLGALRGAQTAHRKHVGEDFANRADEEDCEREAVRVHARRERRTRGHVTHRRRV